jgi:hypothetical protein
MQLKLCLERTFVALWTDFTKEERAMQKYYENYT